MKTREQLIGEWQTARAGYTKAVAEWKTVKALIEAATASLMPRLVTARRAKEDAKALFTAASIKAKAVAAEPEDAGFIPGPDHGGYSPASRASEARLGASAYETGNQAYLAARERGLPVDAAIDAANQAIEDDVI